ncbi:MAG: copper chaperone PCu(A)C [Gammaproteobacteria bacterium]|nr:copper chaperone PCu(A)C [Gammaproteobacteria bacterium]
MINRQFQLLLSLILLMLALGAEAAPLNITDAWIKNLPPVVPMRAGYMQIENSSDTPYRITGVESEVFTTIDIHESIEKNGMMSMQPISSLVIEAGTTVKLAPGGIHLMMMEPKQVLKPGDRVNISLEYDNGSTQILQMTVRQ